MVCMEGAMANTCKWILGIAAVALTGTALAQAWPARPVRVIVPWPPGGGTGIVIRPLRIS